MAVLLIIAALMAIMVIGGIIEHRQTQKKKTQHGSAKWAGYWERSKLGRTSKGIYLGEL